MKLTKKLLGFCLILAALFAPTAHAATIEVNPGPVGGPANNLAFEVQAPGALQLDLVFTDNKTLEYGAGLHVFFVDSSVANPTYLGAFLNASGNEIPGTEYFGQVNIDACTSQKSVNIEIIDFLA